MARSKRRGSRDGPAQLRLALRRGQCIQVAQ
jgi:hypothetical protein